ncbi:MAG: NTPase [Calditrichia bacterium]
MANRAENIPPEIRHLYLNGRPGIGKTTLVKKIRDRLPGREVSGFLSEEIRQQGKRMGFTIRTFDGLEATLAHRNFHGAPRVGAYGVSREALDKIRQHLSSHPGPRFWILDEVGKMERCSASFESYLFEILSGPIPTLATIPLRPDAGLQAFLDAQNALIITVTPENRNELVDPIVQWVKTFLANY